ncbi:MAG TPA: indole-3-glycerol phosphate synthase TrpC [bacterium]|nr:indole-3-glycerol phosphate synthase TrpC [bacterium]HPQ66884.1 indole-3-glycerol phosphate synthase TrpC [bacterium]
MNTAAGSFLERVRGIKEAEVERRREERSTAELAARIRDLPPCRDFAGALRAPGVSLIAEIKRRSPSAGAIVPGAVAAEVARGYAAGGAAAISVLTDAAGFGGSLDDMREVRAAVDLPLLRKDFIVDGYQLLEAREAGADAVLLIAELLDDGELRTLLERAADAGLACLAEAHGREGLERVVAAGAAVVGINNRNLADLSVDPGTALRLLPLVPPGRVRVAESGIDGPERVREAEAAGADAVLVGEALMRGGGDAGAVSRLLGAARRRFGP